MRKMLSVPSALAVACAIGCGGDSTGPSNLYPNVSGTYAVSGTFDDAPGEIISGTLTLAQPDRSTGTFGGDITLFLTGVSESVTGSLPSTSTVSKDGLVNFVLTDGTDSWVFSGTLNGKVITGRQTLTGSGSAFSGPWTATRP